MKSFNKNYIFSALIFAVLMVGVVVYFAYNKVETFDEVGFITHGSDSGQANDNIRDIKILTPNAGDILYEGKSFDINWQFDNPNYPYVSITLQHSDGMCEWLIHDNGRSCIGGIVLPNTGVYSFEIPYDLIPGDYRFYIEACTDKESCPPFYMSVAPRTISKNFKIEPQLWQSTTTITKEKWGASFSVTPEWQMTSNIADSVDLINKNNASRNINLFYYPSPEVNVPYGSAYYWNIPCGGWCVYGAKRNPDFYITDNIPVFVDTTKGERRYIVALEHELFLIIYTNDGDNDGFVMNLVKSIKLLK